MTPITIDASVPRAADLRVIQRCSEAAMNAGISCGRHGNGSLPSLDHPGRKVDTSAFRG
jgi:hypothetical protein